MSKPGPKYLLGDWWLRALYFHLRKRELSRNTPPFDSLRAACAERLRYVFRMLRVSTWFLRHAPVVPSPVGRTVSVDDSVPADGRDDLRVEERIAFIKEIDRMLAFQLDPGFDRSRRLFEKLISMSDSRRNMIRALREVHRYHVENPDAGAPPARPRRASERRRAGLVETGHEPFGNESVRIAGPSWIEAMFEREGINSVRDSAESAAALIVCICGSADHGTIDEILSSSRFEHAQKIAWVIDDDAHDTERQILSRCDRVFVSDNGLQPRLEGLLSVPTSYLPPAIQPTLHNPFLPDTSWSTNEDIPASWRTLFATAHTGATDSLRSTGTWESWMDDDTARAAAKCLSIRNTMANASLGQRIAKMGEVCCLGIAKRRDPLVSFVVPTKRPQNLRGVFESVARQTYSEKELVLVLNKSTFDEKWIAKAFEEYQLHGTFVRARDDWSLGECVQHGSMESNGDVISKMDDDNFYGENYISDLIMLLQSARTAVMGKLKRFLYLADARTLALRNGVEYAYDPGSMSGATITFKREVLELVSWRSLNIHEDSAFLKDCATNAIPVGCADRFNFATVRAVDGAHTSRFDLSGVGRYFSVFPGQRSPSDVSV